MSEVSPIKGVLTVNASSSAKDFPYDNLNSGSAGSWRSDPESPLPAWLNFDLGENVLLEKIRVISTTREMAPKMISVDYFGNDLRLIGRDIATLTFNAALPDYQKFQEFVLKEEDHAVKYIRLRILSNWGAKSVQLNAILFFGKRSQKGVKPLPRAGPEDNVPAYVPQQWYVNDRVRYRWEEGQKWYEGRVIHINNPDKNGRISYLIRDDSGWVKDKISPQNTREPQYRRKPRKLRASCSEISLLPIVEALEEEGEKRSEDEDSSAASSSLSGERVDEDEDKEQEEEQPPELQISKQSTEDKNIPSKKKIPMKAEEPKAAAADNNSLLEHKTGHQRKISYNSVSLFDVTEEQKSKPPTLDDNPSSSNEAVPKEEVAIKLGSLAHNGQKAQKASSRNRVIPLGPKKVSPSKQSPAKVTRSGGTIERKSQAPTSPLSKKSQKSATSRWKPKEKVQKGACVLARNFKIKRLNKIYKKCLKEKDGHPMFRNSKGLVLWWYKELGMWMISKWELVGTDKSYAFTRDTSINPVDISSAWKTYNKKTKKWDPDPGAISSPSWLSDEKGEDHLTLSELKNRRHSDEVAAGDDIVVWKVVLSGFRVAKLNNVYLLQENLINGRPHFKSSSGRIVLWWFHRRRFWMLSPQRLVGSDQSYACIEHVGKQKHPKDVQGMWQVYDRNLKKFVENEGAAIQPGVAEKVSLRGFSKVPHLNGVFIETRNWRCNRPTFLKYDAEADVSLVLFYRNSTRQWCVTKDGEIGSTPIVSCEEPGLHPRDYKDRRVWRDARDNILLGVVG